jgi:hypothetical protein
MPKLNPYLIPKENIPKTEEIRYLDQNYQPQSYEEFMKTYEPNEEVEVITEAEYQDRVLNGPQYGPGNEQSKDVAKKVGSIALATSYFTPAVVVTGPATAVGVAGGYIIEKAAEAEGDNDVKEVAKFIKGLSFDAAVDGLSGGTLNAGAPLVAKATKKVCEGISFYEDAKDMATGEYIPNMPGPSQRADIAKMVVKYGL